MSREDQRKRKKITTDILQGVALDHSARRLHSNARIIVHKVRDGGQ